MDNTLFEHTPIPKAYMTLALPVVMGMIVQLIYNMVDTYFIALTGNTHLIAGVSVCAPLFTLMLAFGDIFGLGGSSVIARLLGAKEYDQGRRLSVFCFYSSIVFGILVAIIMLILQQPILKLLGANADTMEYARGYYQIIVAGSPFIIFTLVPNNLLRTVGKPQAAMFLTMLGAVVNIILDPILIFALNMGSRGAAAATIVGYAATSVVSIIYIARKTDALSLNLKQLKINGRELAAILSVGLPASITNLMQTVGVTLTNRSLLPYGSNSIAVMGIVMKIVLIASLVIVGLAFGGQPLIGYVYGSGNKSRLREVLKYAYKSVCGTAAVIAAILAIAAYPMVRIFLSDEQLILQGMQMLRLQMPGMILMGMGLVCICTFQAIGKGLPSLIMSLCRQGIVFAVVIMIMQYYFGYMGVISAQFVADVVTTLIALILLKIYVKPALEVE